MNLLNEGVGQTTCCSFIPDSLGRFSVIAYFIIYTVDFLQLYYQFGGVIVQHNIANDVCDMLTLCFLYIFHLGLMQCRALKSHALDVSVTPNLPTHTESHSWHLSGPLLS